MATAATSAKNAGALKSALASPSASALRKRAATRYTCRMDARNFGPTPPPDEQPRRPGPHADGPPASAIALLLGAFAIALVGGYFLVMKLAGMSRMEDCLMSGRRNCAPIDMPMRREGKQERFASAYTQSAT